MSVEIKGQQFELHKVFCNDFVFRIPRYQRPYAWQVDHSLALLDDLVGPVRSVARLSDIPSLAPYFLGSIVLVKGSAPDSDVIDGQQRLTTLTILLAVLRELVSSDVKNDITEFLCQPGSRALGRAPTYRLTLRERDAQFFRQHIQEPGGIDKLEGITQRLETAQENIRANALALRNRLKEWMATDPDLPDRLVSFLAIRCFLVVVWTPDDEAAFRIFSVLNDRGLDLSHADILKAEVVGAIKPDSLADTYTARWEEAESRLGREAFKDLFAHIRMIYERKKQVGVLLSAFRGSVKPTENPTGFMDKKLLPYAQAFEDIQSADFESVSHEEEINNSLRWLKFIDNIDWIPPAMEAISTMRQKPADLSRFLDDLQRLATGLMLSRTPPNVRIARYAKVLEAMQQGNNLYVATSPLQLSASEQAAAIAAIDGDVYNANRYNRRLILLRLNWELASSKPKIEVDDVTVEHVLPQHPAPTSTWLSWWPQALERDQSVHRLGNLALLTRRKNAAASNFEFAIKKTTYFQTKHTVSNYALTVNIMAEATWTPAVFQKRQSDLVDHLKKAWRLT